MTRTTPPTSRSAGARGRSDGFQPKGPEPFLEAKFAIPRVPAAFVERPRLSAAFDAGRTKTLTLASAGPGWGKTLATAAWAARTPGDVAWVSLDERDNDPQRFWSYVLTSLVRAGAISPDHDLADLRLGRQIDDEVMVRILHGLSLLPNDVSVVLDDFHHITDPAVLSGIEGLLRFPRRPCHLVIVTRIDPVLPLNRLRLSDELAEIRAADLAFVEDEAPTLLRHHGVTVDASRLASLQARMAGWAAGLRLAALSLAKDPTGARLDEYHTEERVVAAYLADEVLNAQTHRVQDFLLATSLLERVTGALADAVTGQSSGSETLAQLEHANAFVSALNGPGRWYHYHPMLRSMLSLQLSRRHPDRIPALHRRAAGWYATHGFLAEALTHAMEAKDWSLLCRLVVDRIVPRLVSMDSREIGLILENLPAVDAENIAEVHICNVARCIARSDYRTFPAHLAQSWATLDALDTGTRVGAELFLHLGSAVQARLEGDASALSAHSRDAVTQAREHDTVVPAAQEYAAIGLANSGMGRTWSGSRRRAMAALDEALAATQELGLELTWIMASGHRGVLGAINGRLKEAEPHGLSAVRLAEARGWTSAVQVGAAFLSTALVSFYRGDLADADRLLDLGTATQPRPSDRLPLAGLLITKARLLTTLGRDREAGEILDVVGDLASGWAPPNILIGWNRLALAELDIATGNLAAAHGRLASVGASLTGRELTCLARALLFADDLDQADRIVATVLLRTSDVNAQVEAWLVRANIADARRQDYEALEALHHAVTLAEPEELRRPFTLFPAVLMSRLLGRALEFGTVGTTFVPSLAEQLLPDGPGTTPPVSEPLTDRERLVLAYLPTMLSNAEIAEQMLLSVNTVKAHLKSVYRKLGVPSRRAAVSRARALGLMPSGRGDQLQVSSTPDGFIASTHGQLPKDVADVGAHGVHGDEHGGGDLLRREEI